jgi:O-antigen ligase
MLMAIGLLLWSYEHRERTRVPLALYILTIILCGVSGVLSGSRAGVLFVGIIVVFSLFYIPIRMSSAWAWPKRIAMTSFLVIITCVVIGTALFRIYAIGANRDRSIALRQATTEEEKEMALRMPTYASMPSIDPVLDEIAQPNWQEFIENPMLMRSGYQGILAIRQHDEYFWYGAGARSFRRLSGNYIDKNNPEEADWEKRRMGIGQANVHNDTLQFLAEHGWIGYGLMLACMLCLLVPFMRDLIASPKNTQSDLLDDRCWFNRICAFHLFAFLALLMITFHSFIELVFRSPACLMLWGLLFVCATGFTSRQPQR